MKESKQYPLPLEIEKSADSQSPAARQCATGGVRVSMAAYIEIQNDKKTFEIAKKYIDHYKIFG